MTTRLSLIEFIEFIKDVVRHLSRDSDVGQNGPRSHSVETLTPSMPMALQQSSLSRTPAIKSGATVAAPLVVSRARRFWSANQEGSWYVEHTRSNLG